MNRADNYIRRPQMNNKSSRATEGHQKLNEKTFLSHQRWERSQSLCCKSAPTSRLRPGRICASPSQLPQLLVSLRCESEGAAVMWTLLPGPLVGVWRWRVAEAAGGQLNESHQSWLPSCSNTGHEEQMVKVSAHFMALIIFWWLKQQSRVI